MKKNELDLEEDIKINLSETDTYTFLFIPSSIIYSEHQQFQNSKRSNEDYKKLMQAKKGSDNFNDRASQTLSYPEK